MEKVFTGNYFVNRTSVPIELRVTYQDGEFIIKSPDGVYSFKHYAVSEAYTYIIMTCRRENYDFRDEVRAGLFELKEGGGNGNES